MVPLGPQGSGKVELSNNKVQITVPDEGDFDSWISGLREQINKLDPSMVRKNEE